MSEVPRAVEKSIIAVVRKDLDPSLLLVFLKTGFAISFGGFLSLFICGQFGMGLTGLSQKFSQSLHHHIGMMGCAFVCGAIFTLLPVIMLRFLSSPLQFRAILFKKWQPAFIWLCLFGAFFVYRGEMGGEFLQFVAWIGGAYLICGVFGTAVDRLGAYFQIMDSHP